MTDPKIKIQAPRFATVPEWVLDSDITANAIRVYALLTRYGNTPGHECNPSRGSLARRARFTVDTLDRAIKELEQIGAITVQRQTMIKPPYSPNVYIVHTHPYGDGRVGAAMVDGRVGAAMDGRVDAAMDSRTGAAMDGRVGAAQQRTVFTESSISLPVTALLERDGTGRDFSSPSMGRCTPPPLAPFGACPSPPRAPIAPPGPALLDFGTGTESPPPLTVTETPTVSGSPTLALNPQDIHDLLLSMGCAPKFEEGKSRWYRYEVLLAAIPGMTLPALRAAVQTMQKTFGQKVENIWPGSIYNMKDDLWPMIEQPRRKRGQP